MTIQLVIILVSAILLIQIIVLLNVIKDKKNPEVIRQLSELEKITHDIEKLDNLLREEFRTNRQEANDNARSNRDELTKSLNTFKEQFSKNVFDFNEMQRKKFDELKKQQSEQNREVEERLERMRITIESKLRQIQDDNNQKLEKMRETVDEKLQKTLNERIGESFKIVSSQLEQVFKGLGDMQKLATGVGDLKKVLSNVKTRGTLGEVQLGTILSQFLSPEQFVQNARIKPNSTEAVEFAVKLPGQEEGNDMVLLPIDSKFPIEDYQRLMEVYENLADFSREEIQKAELSFDSIVKRAAKLIGDKYINPPQTTNFALMFVPTEGLYAQILRRTGLFEFLQKEYYITVVGPSNLVAFLSSLQMGFRTLAVQKRSGEVWKILGAVKTEFNEFEKVLVSAQKQIQQAGGSLDKLITTRTRVMKRKLREIDEQPSVEASQLLGLGVENEIDNETDEMEE